MRTTTLVFCLLAVVAVPASCSGRSRRAAYPQRAMMFSGYFGRPVPAQYYPSGYNYGRPGFVTRAYEPQGAMTAFAAGNTVAAGSGFYGGGANDVNGNGNGNGNGVPQQPDCSQCNGAQPPVSAEQPEPEAYPEPEPAPAPGPVNSQEDQPEEQPALPPPAESDESELPKDQPAPPQPQPLPQAPPTSAEAPQEETGRDITPKGEKKPAGRPPRRRPVQDEDDDDDDDDELSIPGLPLPGKRRKGNGNSYNSFFPMVFGSYPGSRSGGGEAPPGVATAIANSFSTGKGAVATSHATAYGGPHLLGNGSNGYRKNGASARLRVRS